MGDRISVSFRKEERWGKDNENKTVVESVALFSHWGGEGFVHAVFRFIKSLARQAKDRSFTPLDRLEPGTLMVDYISKYCDGATVESDLYLGKDGNDGDNSDNGHFVIDVTDKENVKLITPSGTVIKDVE